MTQAAKQTLLLILIAATLGLAFVGFALSEGSLAWFADNDKVTASGLSVNAKVSPNLIIAASAEELASDEIEFSIDFTGMARKDMVAVTHDETVADTYLKYVDNPHAVNSTTGNAKDGMTLSFKPVLAGESEKYFVDYPVYIASAFAPLSVSSLRASIIKPVAVDDTQPYFNAMSIDFYVGEVNAENFRGTTSVADSIAESINKPENMGIELLPGGATVPLNTSGDYVKVIMRCYFDGALQNPETNEAYINSYTVGTENVVISVSFSATDDVATE